MKTFSNSNLTSYDEETALINLNANIKEGLDRQIASYEKTGEDFPEEFHIIVNGISHAFCLGGPQVVGLERFIANICEENGYELPWEKEYGDEPFDVVMTRILAEENKVK